MSDIQQPSGRRRERYTLSEDVSVFDQNSNTLLGSLVNIHEDGLMLMSTSPLLLADHLYQLSIRLPEDILDSDELDVGVDCLWVKRSEDSSAIQWAGCQIIDISELARAQILELTKRLG